MQGAVAGAERRGSGGGCCCWSLRGLCVVREEERIHTNMAQKSLETPLLGSARSLGEIKLEKTPNDDDADDDDDGQQDADADADDDGSLQWVVVFFRRHKSRMRNFLTGHRQHTQLTEA